MNILFRNSTDFWVPTYVFNDTSYLNWWNLPYFLLVFLLIFVCCWLTFYMIIVMRDVRKFHENATYLLCAMYGAWFEGLVGSAVILLYKYGVIDVTDSNRVIEGFENTDDYLKMDEIPWKSVPLLLGTFLVWHYLGVINSGFSWFFFERTLATVLLRDYESVARPRLRVFIVVCHQVYALIIAVVMCFHVFPLKHLLAMNASGLLFLGPYLLILRNYNVSARNRMRMARNITKHSLTAKFQTEENVRSIFLASRIAIILAVFDVVFLTIAILATMKVAGTRYYFQAIEHFIFFGPLFLVPAVVSSVADWRKRFLLYIPISKLRIDPDHNPYVVPDNQQESTNIHFLQLQTLWV